jgi:beta-lactam-binding protein with PASTA domain
MSEPNTPHDPSSTPLWSPEEPGADASGADASGADASLADAAGAPSDATQPWDPSEIQTAAATGAAADAGLAVDSATESGSGVTEPWAAGAQSDIDGEVTAAPAGAAGVALGVASGRPRIPEEPPVGRKTPPTAIVGGVIGLAIVVALGAWFLLLQPGGPNTAAGSPSPSPIVVVTPSPEPTVTDEPTAEPTEESTPASTPFQAPTFTGRSLEEAEDLASSGGLTLDVRFDTTTNEPDGIVLSQAPPPGSAVLPGDEIFLLVAQAGPTVLVPDILGVEETDALNLLIESDLRPGERSQALDPDVAEGEIISTDPVAGEEVDRGSSVDYVVSSGSEPSAEPTPETVQVPDLAGVPADDAVNQLLDVGLEPGDRTDAYDAEVAGGAVIGTSPAAGAEVEPGTSVDYTVSLGVEPVIVPDLRGVPADDAVNQLLDVGLEPGDRRLRFNDNVPEGLVIRTDPAAGAEVAPGTPVEYFVSRGVEPTPTPEPTPATVVVPDVRGFAEADALNTLLDAGLQPGERSDAFDADIAADLIIGTDPAAGIDVDRGTTVDFLVSRGPEPTPEPTPAPVNVPDLRGFTPEDATNALIDFGLQPGEQADRFNDRVPEGQVIRTDPEAGTEVEPGSVVDLVVSRGPDSTPTPEPTPATVIVPELRGVAVDDAVNQLLDVGLEPGERSDTFDPEVAEGAVVSTDPAADSEVEPGTPVALVVSLGAEPTPQLVTVPNLRGVDADDAVNALIDLGLQPGERQDRFNDNVQEGQVIRTDPEAGTEVEPGTLVDYRVSRGPEATPEPTEPPTPEPPSGRVIVPDLRGADPDDAVNALIDLGLEPGRRLERVNDSVPVGEVIRTVPEAGSEVEPGTTVDYYVSREPDATEEPTVEPTAEPTEEPGQGFQAAVDEVAAQVPAIRELEPREEVPYREISQREFRRMVTASFDEENPRSRVAAEETLLKRLGLLPRGADLRELMLDLYESQVAAFYDPETGAMTVIQRDGDFGPEDRLFVAHEYVHALQDQYWDLEQVTDVSASQGDRALARLALIEGDATTAMLQWATQNLSQDELAEIGSSLTPADQELLDSMPAILRRQLEFPYLDGQVFVSTLVGQGGWDTVNEAWDRLPASTEQILHPERYPDDAPVRVEMPDVVAALGDGWKQAYVQTLGELDMSVLLADAGDGASAADGWGGDRLLSLEGPDGSWAVVWQTAWDSGTDADEFSAAADSVMGGMSGTGTVLPGADITGALEAPVLVLLANDEDTLQQVQEALGVSE